LNDFPETVGNVIIPTDTTDELIFFRGVGEKPPTSLEFSELLLRGEILRSFLAPGDRVLNLFGVAKRHTIVQWKFNRLNLGDVP